MMFKRPFKIRIKLRRAARMIKYSIILKTDKNMSDADIQIAKIFGIKDSKKLPAVSVQSLTTYYHFLHKQFVFPIQALYAQDIEPFKTTRWGIQVLGLLDVDASDNIEFYGLFCEAKRGRQLIQIPLADIEVSDKSSNYTLINDYQIWFENNR